MDSGIEANTQRMSEEGPRLPAICSLARQALKAPLPDGYCSLYGAYSGNGMLVGDSRPLTFGLQLSCLSPEPWQPVVVQDRRSWVGGAGQ